MVTLHGFPPEKGILYEHLFMRYDKPIGEAMLKHVDHSQKTCTLSIHMKNDSVKNRGYGTEAEILVVKYAFEKLGMDTVFVDALVTNQRSRHVLEKVGFVQIRADEKFCYYSYNKSSWKPTDNQT